MRAVFLLLLLCLPAGSARAQTQEPAPIERRTPTASLPSLPEPAPTVEEIRADNQWDRLMRQSAGFRPEVRIQAMGPAIRCDLDRVTPDEIFCREHRVGDGPISNLLIPKQVFRVPRRDVQDIREGGRDVSTLLGAGIGVGVGVAIGSANAASRADGAQAIGALLFGLVGGFIGHLAPLRGHVVYRQP